jgi:nitroreductase
VPYWYLDTAMAAMSMLLTAVDEGLGALFFAVVSEEVAPLRAAFSVPDDHDPIGALAVGYDAEVGRRDLSARRRRFEDMVHLGRWGRHPGD